MPTILKTKNSVTTTVVPTTLQQGELAVNITDKKLWVGNAATTPVQLLGTGASATFTGLTVINDATISGLTVGRGGGGNTSNTALGNSVLTNTIPIVGVQGVGNTGVGGISLAANTTGYYNNAIGYGSLNANTSGVQNNAMGYFAMLANTTGSNNTAIGNNALDSNTTGSNNVSIGAESLQANTTASNNTAVGYQAGYSNTTGTRNTFIGYQAGNLGNGDRNVAVGSFCANNMTTGTDNACFGDGAGNVISSGSNNSFIGRGAGSAITTGSKNSILGAYTGNQGGLDIRTASNYIVLSDGDGNPRVVINDSANMVIGTTSFSGAKFQSQGGAGIAIQGQGTGTTSRAFEGGQTNASYAWDVAALQTTRTANSAFRFLTCESDAASTFDKEFILRGDGNAYADGTWNNNGADYAEYFESATGQAIPVGSTVVLDNNKVRLATDSDNADNVIGVVRPKEPSKASMVVGNTAWNKWANKYLTDDFDRYIMEDHDVVEWTDEDGNLKSYESQQITPDIVVPSNAVRKSHDENGKKYQHYKLNPNWNSAAEYVNRENRDEWLIIGLIGQVKVLKGQKMGSRWVKMKDVSANVEEWFIR